MSYSFTETELLLMVSRAAPDKDFRIHEGDLQYQYIGDDKWKSLFTLPEVEK